MYTTTYCTVHCVHQCKAGPPHDSRARQLFVNRIYFIIKMSYRHESLVLCTRRRRETAIGSASKNDRVVLYDRIPPSTTRPKYNDCRIFAEYTSRARDRLYATFERVRVVSTTRQHFPQLKSTSLRRLRDIVHNKYTH